MSLKEDLLAEDRRVTTSVGGETGSEVIQGMPSARLLIAAISLVLASFQFGYNIGVVNTPKQNLQQYFDNDSETLFSVVVAIFVVGGYFSSQITGEVAERYGRRLTLVLLNFPLILGSLLEAFATSFGMIIAGRLFVGIAAGGFTVVVPLMLSEISPVHLRGSYGAINQIAVTVGILISFLIGLKFVNTSNAATIPLSELEGWRYMFGLSSVVAALQIVLAIFRIIPETPPWLISRGKDTEAAVELAKLRDRLSPIEAELNMLRGQSENNSSNENKEKKKITEDLEKGEEQQSENNIATSTPPSPPSLPTQATFRDLFSPPLLRPMLVGILMQLTQQWSGISFVLQFSTSIFQGIVCSNSSDICPAAVGASQGVGGTMLVSSIVSAAVIEKMGRRALMLGGTVGMGLTLLALSLSSKLDDGSHDAVKYVAASSLILFAFFFGISAGPIAWLICAELLPPEAKGRGVSFLVSINWMSNIVATLSFLPLSKIMGSFVYLPFAILMFVAFFLILRFVPETKGRNVNEVVKMLQHPVWP